MEDQILPEDDSIFLNLSDRPDNVSSDALVEDSFSEVLGQARGPDSGGVLTSTPGKGGGRTPAFDVPTASPVPPVSRTRSTSRKGATSGRLRCPKCPSTLANKRTLEAHLRGHVMKGVTSRAPTQQELCQEMRSLLEAAVKEVSKDPAISYLGSKVNDFCASVLFALATDECCEIVDDLMTLLSEKFHQILSGKKVLFPSAIRAAVYVGVNQLLCDHGFRDTLKNHLRSLEGENVDNSVLKVFVGVTVLKLTQKILVYVLRKMRRCENESEFTRKKQSEDSVNSDTFQQVVYHVSGSIVNGYLFKGKQYSKSSQTWASFCETLSNKFLRFKTKENQCNENIRHHTDQKHRGRLKHVNEKAFQFLIVDKNVLENYVVLCLWDELVGNDLNQDNSLDLLIQISESCVKVVLKGILKRRLNEELKQAYSSVALRAKLAQ